MPQGRKAPRQSHRCAFPEAGLPRSEQWRTAGPDVRLCLAPGRDLCVRPLTGSDSSDNLKPDAPRPPPPLVLQISRPSQREGRAGGREEAVWKGVLAHMGPGCQPPKPRPGPALCVPVGLLPWEGCVLRLEGTRACIPTPAPSRPLVIRGRCPGPSPRAHGAGPLAPAAALRGRSRLSADPSGPGARLCEGGILPQTTRWLSVKL